MSVGVMVIAIFGKLAGALATIPEPILGGLVTVGLGTGRIFKESVALGYTSLSDFIFRIIIIVFPSNYPIVSKLVFPAKVNFRPQIGCQCHIILSFSIIPFIKFI